MPEPLVVFTPLPPAKSGIADYAFELLPALAALREVVVVSEQPKPPGEHAWQCIDPAEYERQASLHGCPTFYQLGNNRDHVFVYRACRRRPGILVQHDYNLHYLVEDATLVLGDTASYRNIMEEEYGNAGGMLADLRQMGVFSESQKLTLGLNTHLLKDTRGLIIHSQWVFDRLPAQVKSRTMMVPHHYAPQAAQYDKLNQEDARARLGLSNEGFILLSLGYITPPKQIHATLAALGVLRQLGAQFTYIIGGERNSGFDVDHHIHQQGLDGLVRVTGYLDEQSFFTHIAAADALVNLRYPTVGESSGTLARALAMGLPAIVHNFGPLSEFPEDAVLKVPLELGAPHKLAAALNSMLNNKLMRQAMGNAARQYMRTQCTVERSAQAYIELADLLWHSPPAETGAATAAP